jgi:hypothetical protein
MPDGENFQAAQGMECPPVVQIPRLASLARDDTAVGFKGSGFKGSASLKATLTP